MCLLKLKPPGLLHYYYYCSHFLLIKMTAVVFALHILLVRPRARKFPFQHDNFQFHHHHTATHIICWAFGTIKQ